MTRSPAGVDVFVALGANLDTPLEQLIRAVSALTHRFGDLQAAGVYSSTPEDGSPQPDYLNTVVRMTVRDSPDSVLSFGLGLEQAAGRVRSQANAPRPLDVDLLFYGDVVCRSSRLTIPHPRWAERSFVVVPLLELAADWTDPSSGRSVGQVAEGKGWFPGSLERVMTGPELQAAAAREGV